MFLDVSATVNMGYCATESVFFVTSEPQRTVTPYCCSLTSKMMFKTLTLGTNLVGSIRVHRTYDSSGSPSSKFSFSGDEFRL